MVHSAYTTLRIGTQELAIPDKSGHGELLSPKLSSNGLRGYVLRGSHCDNRVAADLESTIPGERAANSVLAADPDC